MSNHTFLVTTRSMASTYKLRDHNCRFLFIGVGGPGIMGDREVIKESGLYDLVENLPGLLYCVGDCAYTPTEHLIPIYGSDHATKT